MSSPASTIALWGRAWEFTAYTKSGDQYVLTASQWDPEALRMTFDVLQSTYNSPYWFADISIYNLNNVTAQNILYQAVWVTLKAGYQVGDAFYSTIWDGPVLQVLFERENVVDQIIRFNCVSVANRNAVGELLSEDPINQAYGTATSQLQIVSSMIAASNGGSGTPLTPAQMKAQISQRAQSILGANVYPQGRTVFAKPSKYIEQLADNNFVNYWRNSQNQHQLSELYDGKAPLNPSITYGPPLPANSTNSSGSQKDITLSILGVPKQSTFGCLFTVELDPRLRVAVPPMAIKLDNIVIQQLKIQLNQLPGILDQSGVYIVGQVHHRGDTRSNDWITEVTGYTPQWAQNVLNGFFSAIAAPGTTP